MARVPLAGTHSATDPAASGPALPDPKPTSQASIMAGLGLALLLLLAVAIASFRSTVELTEVAAMTKRGQLVLTRIATLLSTITDAETGSRGYVITGDTAFLDTYQAAAARVDTEFNALHQLTADNPHPQLDTLKPLLAARMTAIQAIIEQRRTRGFAEAQRIIAAGEGKRIHDTIRQVIADMTQEDTRLLVQREEHTRSASRITLLIIVIGAVGMLLLVVAVQVIIHRGFRARQQQEERFREVIEASPNSIVSVNAAGNITSVNVQTEQLFGYTHAELIGQPVDVLLPERLRTAHAAQPSV